jgi:hypothetical protein
MPTHAEDEEFHLHTRDLYVPAGDIGMWQGALRNPDDPLRRAVAEAIDAREPMSVELMYTDQIGQQRTITRFGLMPAGDGWIASVTRHWYLDWEGPRPESAILEAVEAVQRDREVADRRARGLGLIDGGDVNGDAIADGDAVGEPTAEQRAS